MNKLRIGFALTGSFCTFSSVIPVIRELAERDADITVIMSQAASSFDTRFGNSADFKAVLGEISSKPVITTIAEAEPIGPKKLFDILVIAPCTGNTLGKLANGITDTSVTMAAKAHLRNARPLVIAVSTNDALGMSAKNIGLLLSSRNIYFVPMRQDDCEKKPASVVADFSRIPDTIKAAMSGTQIQPVYC